MSRRVKFWIGCDVENPQLDVIPLTDAAKAAAVPSVAIDPDGRAGHIDFPDDEPPLDEYEAFITGDVEPRGRVRWP